MSAAFGLFVVLVACGVVAIAGRFVPGPLVPRMAAVLACWMLYVGMVSASGLIRDPTLRPPGIALIAVPVVLFIGVAVARSATALRVALAVPLPLLLAAQGFRIGVEFFLHRLWLDGQIPRMLTFAGANVDLAVALTAPLAAAAATRGRLGRRIALAWNVAGLLSLANVVIRSALTAPGPFHFVHAEVPNLAIGTFPFTYIAGFFAPLAVTLHVLSIRAIRARGRNEHEATRIEFGPARPS